MNLSRIEILERFNLWLDAWDNYDLEVVMEFMHEEIVFENWNGIIISGKSSLQKVWSPWFKNHGNFKFHTEDVFVDVQEQKMSFQWRLEWPSTEFFYRGLHEIRRGVDIIHLKEGKINKKYTYSKTGIQIDSKQVSMHASEKGSISK